MKVVYEDENCFDHRLFWGCYHRWRRNIPFVGTGGHYRSDEAA